MRKYAPKVGSYYELWAQIASQNFSYRIFATHSFTFYNKGTLVDPYNRDLNLIRNQKHIVELPENVDDVINYDGQIKINVTNGDSFSGNFQDGEREGFGVLTFGLIHQRYSIVKDSNANSGVIFKILQNSPIIKVVNTKIFKKSF